MAKIVVIDGLEYVQYKNARRLNYNPEFHEHHRKWYSKDEKIYLCSMWDAMKKADLCLALGRTVGSVYRMGNTLKTDGRFNLYKKLGQAQFN